MGEEQRLSPDEQIALAREQFENATDFTIAVEEEFAKLLALPPDERAAVSAAARRTAVARWSWASVAERLLA